jgi:hypothetical protein
VRESAIRAHGSAQHELVAIAKREPVSPYRCEATMSDGSAAVLFASCHGPALGVAMSMARETWEQLGQDPVEIRIYAGGQDKAEGRVLAR